MLARIKSLRFFAYIAYQVVLVRTLYGTRTAHMFMGRNFGIWWARPPLFVGVCVLHPGRRGRRILLRYCVCTSYDCIPRAPAGTSYYSIRNTSARSKIYIGETDSGWMIPEDPSRACEIGNGEGRYLKLPIHISMCMSVCETVSA